MRLVYLTQLDNQISKDDCYLIVVVLDLGAEIYYNKNQSIFCGAKT